MQIYDDNFDINFILGTIMIIYIISHVINKPFKYKRLNYSETICLISLTSIITSNNINSKNILFTQIYITICILIPIFILFSHIIKSFIFINI